MALGDFYTSVADAIGRGSSLDVKIPRWARRSARFIERNYGFQYMKRWMQLVVDPDADYPHIISLGSNDPKMIRSLRYMVPDSTDGILYELQRIEPEDRTQRSTNEPISGYWLDGVGSIVLDQIPSQAYTLEMHADIFTVWGSNNSWDHWLLRNAEDLLIARTLMTAAKELRDPKMHQTWKAEFLDEQTTFNVSEEALQHGGKTDRMEWTPTAVDYDLDYDNGQDTG